MVVGVLLEIVAVLKGELDRTFKGLCAELHCSKEGSCEPLEKALVATHERKQLLVFIIREEEHAVLPYVLVRSDLEGAGGGLDVGLDLHFAIERCRFRESEEFAAEVAFPERILFASLVIHYFCGHRAPSATATAVLIEVFVVTVDVEGGGVVAVHAPAHGVAFVPGELAEHQHHWLTRSEDVVDLDRLAGPFVRDQFAVLVTGIYIFAVPEYGGVVDSAHLAVHEQEVGVKGCEPADLVHIVHHLVAHCEAEGVSFFLDLCRYLEVYLEAVRIGGNQGYRVSIFTGGEIDPEYLGIVAGFALLEREYCRVVAFSVESLDEDFVASVHESSAGSFREDEYRVVSHFCARLYYQIGITDEQVRFELYVSRGDSCRKNFSACTRNVLASWPTACHQSCEHDYACRKQAIDCSFHVQIY